MKIWLNEMVVGNGLIGRHFQQAFTERGDVLIFASGVSDSREERASEFERERALLKRCVKDHHSGDLFVYFSTMSIYDRYLQNNPYQQHKLAIEQYLKDNLSNYLIIRAPNVIGQGGNSSNLVNFLYSKIKHQEPFQVWEHAERNILDVRDLRTLVEGLINHYRSPSTVDLVYPYSYDILEIVAVIEACLLKRAHYEVIDKGASHVPGLTKELRDLYKTTGVYVNRDYLVKVVRRCFGCKS